ncbi:MAG: hypothetical protein P8L37_03225 [Phycisphaerales bacterium]|nr:hypothetical protein [Phycisphaerales bacterium]
MTKFLQHNALSLVFVVILVSFATSWKADAERYAAMSPTVVATVNLSTVMNGLSERADLSAELAAKVQVIQAEDKRRTEELQARAMELNDVVAPERLAALQDELDLLLLQRGAWQQFSQQEIDIDRSLMLEGIFQSMKESALELAEIEGIDLILIETSEDDIQIAPDARVSREQQVAEQISSRRVLWREQAIDISDELIIRMNNDYAASTGGR